MKPTGVAIDEGQTERLQDLFTALHANPHQGDLLHEAAALLYDAGEIDSAATILERFHVTGHSDVRSWGMLASAYYVQGHLELAIQAAHQALRLDAQYGDLWLYLGAALAGTGNFEPAIQSLEAASLLLPTEGGVADRLWRTKLLAGRWREGWHDCLALVPPAIDELWRQARGTGHLFWRGQPLEGQEIIVFNHGGHGDVINFLRFVDQLAALKPARITLQVAAPLRRLVMASVAAGSQTAGIQVIEEESSLEDRPGFFTWFEGLAAHFRASPEMMRDQLPYLAVDETAAALWQRRLGAAGHQPGSHIRPRIGIIWRGKRSTADDQWRSIPLERWRGLLMDKGFDFYALQNAPLEDVEKDLLAEWGVTDLSSDFADFAELAAIMKGLDAIISVDTGSVHLAGALGCKTFLLNRANSEWRWGWKQERSFWYPDVTIINQERLNEWEEPLDRVAALLRSAMG